MLCKSQRGPGQDRFKGGQCTSDRPGHASPWPLGRVQCPLPSAVPKVTPGYPAPSACLCQGSPGGSLHGQRFPGLCHKGWPRARAAAGSLRGAQCTEREGALHRCVTCTAAGGWVAAESGCYNHLCAGSAPCCTTHGVIGEQGATAACSRPRCCTGGCPQPAA